MHQSNEQGSSDIPISASNLLILLLLDDYELKQQIREMGMMVGKARCRSDLPSIVRLPSFLPLNFPFFPFFPFFLLSYRSFLFFSFFTVTPHHTLINIAQILRTHVIVMALPCLPTSLSYHICSRHVACTPMFLISSQGGCGLSHHNFFVTGALR